MPQDHIVIPVINSDFTNKTSAAILFAWILYFDTTRFFYQEYLKSTDIENTAQPTACGSALLRLFAAVDPLTDSAALKQHRNIS